MFVPFTPLSRLGSTSNATARFPGNHREIPRSHETQEGEEREKDGKIAGDAGGPSGVLPAQMVSSNVQ